LHYEKPPAQELRPRFIRARQRNEPIYGKLSGALFQGLPAPRGRALRAIATSFSSLLPLAATTRLPRLAAPRRHKVVRSVRVARRSGRALRHRWRARARTPSPLCYRKIATSRLDADHDGGLARESERKPREMAARTLRSPTLSACDTREMKFIPSCFQRTSRTTREHGRP